MAIANADGSIILSTNVDTSGIKKGLGTLKKDTSSITQGFKSLAAAIGLAFSVTRLVQFSKESASLATQTEASVRRLIDIYGDASNEISEFIDANARALGMSKASAASFASVYGNLFSVWADQQTNAQLTAHYLNATAVVASKTGRTMEDVQERIRSGLLGNTEAVEDLGIFVNVKTIEMTEAFQRVADGRSWEQLNNAEQSQVRTLAILEQATKKYGDEVSGTTALTKARFNAAYEDFKNTWGQIVNLVLVPVLNVLTKIFSVATALINNLMGNTGSIAENTEQISNSIGGAAENQKELTDEVKKTNKELKKTLAGFDDLQILTSGSSGSTSSTGGGTVNVELGELPEVASGVSNFDPMAYAAKINEAIAAVLPYISIGLVVIGLFLLSCGNIPWGVGFIIGGASLYAVSQAGEGEFDFESIKSKIEDFESYIPGLLVAIGVILLFLGQLPWGIGFIIGGAVTYSVQEMSTGEFNTATIEEKLAILGEAVSLALVTIGVLLIFFGYIPLGIGFIVAGKALLDVSEQKLGESDIVTDIQKFFEEFDEIIATVSFAVLMLGVILLVSGIFSKLSIGLVVAGATGLAATVTISEGSITTKIENFIRDNWGAVMAISGALLVIGIILLFTPASFPLAISLVSVGAAGLTAVVAVNWTAIVENIKSFLFENSTLLSLISGGLLILGIILLFTPASLPLAIGLVVAGATGLAATVTISEGSITTKIENFIRDNWGAVMAISGALLVIGIILLFTPASFSLAISLISVGAAGLTAVVEVNWTAIVENIKSFLFENSTLLALISGGLLILGIILCATGVSLPLGIALISVGAAGLVTVTALNFGGIVQWVKDAWDAVKKYWNEKIAPVFTFKWWANLFGKVWEGIKSAFSGMTKWFSDTFGAAWQAVVDVFSPLGEVFVDIKDGIIEVFKKVVNGLIDGINRVISLPFEGINSIFDNIQSIEIFKIKPFEGLDWRIPVPEIPHLAKGAVIPGNREFLAVLGDQPAGQTNIETPLDTMIEAFNTALDGRGDTVREEHYYLSETELMSVLYKLVKGGERIQGTSLVNGGGY